MLQLSTDLSINHQPTRSRILSPKCSHSVPHAHVHCRKQKQEPKTPTASSHYNQEIVLLMREPFICIWSQ